MSDSNISSAPQTNSSKPKAFGKLWPFLQYSFIAYIIVETFLTISNYLAFRFFYTFQNDGFESDQALANAANFTDLHQGIIGILFLIVFILSVVAYGRFQYRAMKNLHALGAAGVVTSPGWSVGYFFVPIVNLWKPFGAVCQIWRGTFDPENGAARVPAIIGWWWAFWLITNFIDNASFRLTLKSGAFGDEIMGIDAYMAALAFDIASSIFAIVAAILVLNFFRQVFDEQTKMIEASLPGSIR